jgi:uncharacterized coiled-coil protein SlyX
MTIEEKIIFLENDIEKLNMAIYMQDKKIADLEKTLQILHKNMQESSNNSQDNSLNNSQSNDDAPPHY